MTYQNVIFVKNIKIQIKHTYLTFKRIIYVSYCKLVDTHNEWLNWLNGLSILNRNSTHLLKCYLGWLMIRTRFGKLKISSLLVLSLNPFISFICLQYPLNIPRNVEVYFTHLLTGVIGIVPKQMLSSSILWGGSLKVGALHSKVHDENAMNVVQEDNSIGDKLKSFKNDALCWYQAMLQNEASNKQSGLRFAVHKNSASKTILG